MSWWDETTRRHRKIIYIDNIYYQRTIRVSKAGMIAVVVDSRFETHRDGLVGES